MMRGLVEYLTLLPQVAGAAWNRFWFTAIPPTSLAIVRIVAGLVAIDYFVSWAPDLQYWFGTGGILTTEVVRGFLQPDIDSAGNYYGVTYLGLLTHPWALNAGHALAIAVAVGFTLGIYTRVTGVLLWLALLAYMHRAPMLTTQLDPVLTAMLAYLAIGASGARWSWDAWRRSGATVIGESNVGRVAGAESTPSVANNVSLRLMQVHLAAFYLLFGLSKLGGEVWWNGEALWWLVAQPDSPLLDLTGGARSPMWLYAWTHFIVAVELSYPILIWSRWARPMVMAAAILSWASLAVVTGRVSFCLLMIGLQTVFFNGSSPWPGTESDPGDPRSDA